MAKRVGVVFSGCGHRDGSEIHEAVLTMLSLDRAGAEIICVAPDVGQSQVVDHLNGEKATVNVGAAAIVVPGVSTFTLELAKGAIRTMTVTKLQWAAAVVAVCGSLTAGGVLAMGQGAGAPPVAGGPGRTRCRGRGSPAR